MFYYSHNISNFNNATRHLTRIERSVYRDLIDLYYETEQPLKFASRALLARKILCKTDEELDALNNVLEEFFVLEDGAYTQGRCDTELAAYHANTSAKALAGKASAAAKKTKKEAKKALSLTNSQQSINEIQQDINETQLTNNYKLITNKDIDTDKGNFIATPYNDIVAAYNNTCTDLSGVVSLNDNRKKSIATAWKFFLNPKNLNPSTEEPWATNADEAMAMIQRFLNAVSNSDFLCGRTNGEQSWKANIDWIFKQGNFLKIIEGNYLNAEKKTEAYA